MEVRKKTYGIDFPFNDSNNGDFLKLTEIPEREIKSNLIHLLLTNKGSRYYLPEFGTNLYQYIFEPLDDITMIKIEDEINSAVERFIPNLKINKINIINATNDTTYKGGEQKISISIDYTITSKTFQMVDNVVIMF
jgi:phage baseplate assembly protein W